MHSLLAALIAAAVAVSALAGGGGGDEGRAPRAAVRDAPRAQVPDAPRAVRHRGAPERRPIRDVTIGDNFFVRDRGVPTVTVRRGDTVRFRFRGDAPHTVVVTRGPTRFRSPVRVSGSYRRTTGTAGQYTLVCTIHGAADQRMTLRVR